MNERGWDIFDALTCEHPMLNDLKDWMLPPFTDREETLGGETIVDIKPWEMVRIWKRANPGWLIKKAEPPFTDADKAHWKGKEERTP